MSAGTVGGQSRVASPQSRRGVYRVSGVDSPAATNEPLPVEPTVTPMPAPLYLGELAFTSFPFPTYDYIVGAGRGMGISTDESVLYRPVVDFNLSGNEMVGAFDSGTLEFIENVAPSHAGGIQQIAATSTHIYYVHRSTVRTCYSIPIGGGTEVTVMATVDGNQEIGIARGHDDPSKIMLTYMTSTGAWEIYETSRSGGTITNTLLDSDASGANAAGYITVTPDGAVWWFVNYLHRWDPSLGLSRITTDAGLQTAYPKYLLEWETNTVHVWDTFENLAAPAAGHEIGAALTVGVSSPTMGSMVDGPRVGQPCLVGSGCSNVGATKLWLNAYSSTVLGSREHVWTAG
jgi:hypothetical protein